MECHQVRSYFNISVAYVLQLHEYHTYPEFKFEEWLIDCSIPDLTELEPAFSNECPPSNPPKSWKEVSWFSSWFTLLVLKEWWYDESNF